MIVRHVLLIYVIRFLNRWSEWNLKCENYKTEDTYYKNEFNNVYKTIINSTVEKHVFDIEKFIKLNSKNSKLLIK